MCSYVSHDSDFAKRVARPGVLIGRVESLLERNVMLYLRSFCGTEFMSRRLTPGVFAECVRELV